MSIPPEPTRNDHDHRRPDEDVPRLEEVDEIPRPGQQAEDVEETDREPPH
jgi:hypothetical protein